jgi:hypothetical protein
LSCPTVGFIARQGWLAKEIELISPSIQYGRFERRPAPQQVFNPQNKIKIFGYERLKNLNF